MVDITKSASAAYVAGTIIGMFVGISEFIFLSEFLDVTATAAFAPLVVINSIFFGLLFVVFYRAQRYQSGETVSRVPGIKPAKEDEWKYDVDLDEMPKETEEQRNS